MTAHGYEIIEVRTPEEWAKVAPALDNNLRAERAVHLRADAVIDKGWVLRELMDPASGMPVQLTSAQLPVSLCFEADDEAEREMQAEIEAERSNSAGDTREGLSKDEWQSLVPREPSFQRGQPHIRLTSHAVLQRAVDDKHHGISDAPNLFRLSEMSRAHVVVHHIARQAAACLKDLEIALTALTQACEEEESTDVAFSQSLIIGVSHGILEGLRHLCTCLLKLLRRPCSARQTTPVWSSYCQHVCLPCLLRHLQRVIPQSGPCCPCLATLTGGPVLTHQQLVERFCAHTHIVFRNYFVHPRRLVQDFGLGVRAFIVLVKAGIRSVFAASSDAQRPCPWHALGRLMHRFFNSRPRSYWNDDHRRLHQFCHHLATQTRCGSGRGGCRS